MSSVQAPSNSDGAKNPVWRSLEKIRQSLLLSLATIGVFFVLLGYVIQTGVWAALLAVWGSGLFIAGVGGYSFVWWRRS